MAKARLAKLSVCSCGFPLLNENLSIGTEYEVLPQFRRPLDIQCGGCGKILEDLPSILVAPRGQSRAGYLPAEVFDIDMPENEIGRELKASELVPGKVVVIAAPGKNVMLTMWVSDKTPELAVFYSAVMNWGVINFVQPDDTLHDEQGRVVRVFEYLGKV